MGHENHDFPTLFLDLVPVASSCVDSGLGVGMVWNSVKSRHHMADKCGL